MKYLYLLLILMLVAATPVFAVRTIQQRALTDTFVMNSITAPQNASTHLQFINQSDSNNGCGTKMLFKLFNSTIDGIVDNATFIYTGSYYYGNGGLIQNPISGTFFYLHNSLWPADVNYTTFPTGTSDTLGLLTVSATCNTLGCVTYQHSANDPIQWSSLDMMNNFYQGQNITIYTCAPNTAGDNAAASIFSDELAVNESYWNLSLVSFKTYYVSATDVTTLYFDFETGTVTTYFINGDDMQYDLIANVLYPISPRTISFNSFDASTANTLSAKLCTEQNAQYFSLPAGSINVANQYQTYCFNLTQFHGVATKYPFYGAIKVVNNTNVRGGSQPDFDGYIAIYAPDYVSMSIPRFQTPTANAPVDILWDTSIPMDSKIFLAARINATNFSDYGVYYNSANTTAHFIEIPAANLIPNHDYKFYAESSNGTVILDSEVQFFTTAFSQQAQGGIGVTDGIHIKVTDQANRPLFGYVALDNNNALNPTQNRTDNASAYGYSWVASFYGFANVNHNFTVSTDGYFTRTVNYTVSSQPAIFTVALSPSNRCEVLVTGTDENNCKVNMPVQISVLNGQGFNYTNWYCSFDSAACTGANPSPICQGTTGLWKGYACYNNYNPFGNSYFNNSVPIGTVPSTTTGGGISTAVGDPLAALFGTSSAMALMFIAMLITMAVTIGVAVKVHDGLVTSIVFLGMISVFTGLGWISVWVWVILGVISAFLIAKFVRQAGTPQ